VYGTRLANINELKCKLLREWAKVGHEIIASAIRQWRLRACETADGGHIEQAFCLLNMLDCVLNKLSCQVLRHDIVELFQQNVRSCELQKF